MVPVSQPAVSVPIRIHPSQFPAAVDAALVAAIERRRMNHKFHYDSPKQAQRWLRVHEAFSPARRDESAVAAYRQAGLAAARIMQGSQPVDLLSLGCGGGQKDVAMLRALSGADVGYTPTDVSAGLCLVAREAAVGAGLAPGRIHPLVLDLDGTDDWGTAFAETFRPEARRIVAFFGMMPNFEPNLVLKRLAGLVGPDDVLLVSANLAPGPDYVAGVRSVLPLYDNALTADWLRTVLLDLGAERDDGRVEFSVADCPEATGLLRIEADFVFEKPCVLALAGREWRFEPGERFGLFYSYRHTPDRVGELFQKVGLKVAEQWLNAAGDEGVFLLRRPA